MVQYQAVHLFIPLKLLASRVLVSYTYTASVILYITKGPVLVVLMYVDIIICSSYVVYAALAT